MGGVPVWLEAGLEGGPGEGRKGWSDRETGRLKGGRTDAACLSLPDSLSLSPYLFPPSNIDARARTRTRTRSEAEQPKPRVTQIIGRERVFTFTRSATGEGWKGWEGQRGW